MSVKIDSTSNALAERGAERNKKLETYFRRILTLKHKEWLKSASFDYTSLRRYCASADALRKKLISEGLGGWPERPRKIKAKEEYLGELEPGSLYRLEVEVLPDVSMPALLLLPKSAKKKPLPGVICLHGYGGSPEWTMGFGTPREMNYMNSCGHRLSSAGYVVLAPHIVCSPPGIDRDRVRLEGAITSLQRSSCLDGLAAVFRVSTLALGEADVARSEYRTGQGAVRFHGLMDRSYIATAQENNVISSHWTLRSCYIRSVRPPSTQSSWPDMKLDSSDTKKRTAFAISSSVPARFNTVDFFLASICFSISCWLRVV